MLDIKFIRENADLVKKNCQDRFSKVDIEELLKLDGEKRELETRVEDLRAKRNIASKTKMKVSTSTKSLLSPNAKIQTILTEPRPQLYMYLKCSFSTENKKGIYYS